jgi:hypothetical protein
MVRDTCLQLETVLTSYNVIPIATGQARQHKISLALMFMKSKYTRFPKRAMLWVGGRHGIGDPIIHRRQGVIRI